MPDEMRIDIMLDGEIRVDSDEISQANHVSADELLDEMHALLGGETQSYAKRRHTHVHEREHEHVHRKARA